MGIKKEEFVNNYIVTFVATRAALKYEDACMRGDHENLRKHYDMEDAIGLADDAWKAYEEHRQKED